VTSRIFKIFNKQLNNFRQSEEGKLQMLLYQLTQTGKSVVSSSTIFSYWLTSAGALSTGLVGGGEL
jgi:hypothetical protein